VKEEGREEKQHERQRELSHISTERWIGIGTSSSTWSRKEREREKEGGGVVEEREGGESEKLVSFAFSSAQNSAAPK